MNSITLKIATLSIAHRLFLCVCFCTTGLLLQAQIPGVFYYSGEEPTSLKGEWSFVPNQFLDLVGVLEDTTRIYVNVPGDWNGIQINNEKFGPKGYGTYYAKLTFGPNVDLKNLAIRIPEIGIAYSVYLNDNYVGSLGTPSMNPEDEKAIIDPRILELPDLAGTEAYIIIHISNHQFTYGGLFYPPEFGKENIIRVKKERSNTIKLLILGTVIILGIYMLYVYLKLRKERFRLYFAIICLVLLLHTLTTGDMPLLDIFPGIDWAVLKKIAYTSFFLIGASNGMFLMNLFPSYFRQKIIYGISIISMVGVIFTLLASVGIGAYLVYPFQAFTIVTGFYFLERLIRANYDHVEGSRILLVGYVLAFLTGINDILTTSYIISTPQLAHFGMFAYIFHLTLMMAMRYVNALKKNEEAAESLLLSNEYLEKSVEDRTKKLQLKNNLIDAKNRELEGAMKEQEDLMAVVAHDLKAPFNQIQELSELLRDEAKLKKDHSSLVEMILKITSNARRVIDNLVFIRSYHGEAKKLQLRSFDPVVFFESKVAAYESEASKKGIIIEHAQSLQSKEMVSDESALDRIVDNLLSNAIKFSPKQSKIAFEMLEEEYDFVFRIKDYGEGFSNEDKKKLFHKFQKLSTKPTGDELSTGLGLSIVKALVEQLGGDIRLFSEKGKGAEFIIKIPKNKDAVSVTA